MGKMKKEFKKEMRRFPSVNWSEVARGAIERKIEVLKKMDGLLSESRLSEEDAVALGRKISKKLGKVYEG